MAIGLAKRRTNRTRDGRVEAGPTVGPFPSHKRSRLTDVENTDNGGDNPEGPSQHFAIFKAPQISKEPHRPGSEKILPSCRRSLRLLELQESKNKLSSRQERHIKRSSGCTHKQGQSSAELQLNVPIYPQQDQHTWSSQRTGKRRRNIGSEDEPNRPTKRGCRRSVTEVSAEQGDYIEHWLNESCSSLRASIADEIQLLEAADTMPRKHNALLPSPEDSFDRNTSTSRKSDRSTASVHDPNYHQSLRHRNIYIDQDDPPAELMQRAKKIISRPRASPDMDDATVQKLNERSRRLRNDAEDVIVKQLAHQLIPAMDEVPDRRLEMNSDQPWSNSVPVPLKPSILTNPLPLPKPVPDLAFGYSQYAFTENQLGTIELMTDDQFGRSYAVPDQKLRYPFLDIEFKSQAKNGTHYVATNQAANAGAIALSGSMDLTERSFGMETFDYHEPQFFSVTLDHQLACVNVHWVKPPMGGGNHSFHVEGLSQHLLRDPDGIRAVTRAIKNILDYGADVRLRTLCEALDAYRETIVRNREAANPHRPRRHVAQSRVQSEQRRRGSELPLEDTSAKNLRHSSVSRDISANELATKQLATQQHEHRPTATQDALRKSNVVPDSSPRHTVGKMGKSASKMTPKCSNQSRHTLTGTAKESKRQIKPSQKLRDSQGLRPRSRHDP